MELDTSVQRAKQFIGIDVETWDQADTFVFQFTGVLIRDLSDKFKTNDAVQAWFDFQIGELKIAIDSGNNEDREPEYTTYKLNLQLEEVK